MSLPPKQPMENSQLYYFDTLVNLIKKEYSEKGIKLNFRGLESLLSGYEQLDYEDILVAMKFSQAFNLWSGYIATIKGLNNKLFLDSGSFRIYTTAEASIRLSPKNVANGNRFANREQNVFNSKISTNSYDSFNSLLTELGDFLIRCHYEIKLFIDIFSGKESSFNISNDTMDKQIALPPNVAVFKDMNYFEYLKKDVSEDFEKEGVSLNFEGLDELQKEYLEIDYRNTNQCARLSRDFNMWSAYIGTILSTAKKLYLDAETKKSTEIEVASLNADVKTSTNGKRHADKDLNVYKLRCSRNSFQAFHDYLESLEEYLIRCHYEIRFFAEKINSKDR